MKWRNRYKYKTFALIHHFKSVFEHEDPDLPHSIFFFRPNNELLSNTNFFSSLYGQMNRQSTWWQEPSNYFNAQEKFKLSWFNYGNFWYKYSSSDYATPLLEKTRASIKSIVSVVWKPFKSQRERKTEFLKESKLACQISDIRSYSAWFYAIWERGNYCAKSISTASGLGSILHDASMNWFGFYSIFFKMQIFLSPVEQSREIYRWWLKQLKIPWLLLFHKKIATSLNKPKTNATGGDKTRQYLLHVVLSN